MPDIMTPELRAMALRLLGQGALRGAGETVNAPQQAAMMQSQEAQAMGEDPSTQQMPQVTPYGGPAQQSGMGGPVQGFAPGMVPRPNGGQMTPSQAAQLAAILRARQ